MGYLPAYFPIVDPLSGYGELRSIHLAEGTSDAANLEILALPESIEEANNIGLAVQSVNAWEQHKFGSRGGSKLDFTLQSTKASTERSGQLAAAALAFVVRRKVSDLPRCLLVATGALPEAGVVGTRGRLDVLPVEHVGDKAKVVAQALQPTGELAESIASGSKSGFAGKQVLFAYPSATPEVEKRKAREALKGLPVIIAEVGEFEELIHTWHPRALATASPHRRSTLHSMWRTLRMRTNALVLGAALVAVFGWQTDWDAWASRVVVPDELRRVVAVAGQSPDDVLNGCPTLVRVAAEFTPPGSGLGWRAVRQRVEWCAALADCDRNAGAVFDHRSGQTMDAMRNSKELIEPTVKSCRDAASGFPHFGRVRYQLWRALRAADKDDAAQAELARAVELAHPPAEVVDLERRLAGRPADLLARLEELASKPDAHPEAIVTYLEWQLCQMTGHPEEGAAVAPKEAKLQQAEGLIARLKRMPIASTDLATAAWHPLARTVEELRGGRPWAPPPYCRTLTNTAHR